MEQEQKATQVILYDKYYRYAFIEYCHTNEKLSEEQRDNQAIEMVSKRLTKQLENFKQEHKENLERLLNAGFEHKYKEQSELFNEEVYNSFSIEVRHEVKLKSQADMYKDILKEFKLKRILPEQEKELENEKGMREDREQTSRSDVGQERITNAVETTNEKEEEFVQLSLF